METSNILDETDDLDPGMEAVALEPELEQPETDDLGTGTEAVALDPELEQPETDDFGPGTEAVTLKPELEQPETDDFSPGTEAVVLEPELAQPEPAPSIGRRLLRVVWEVLSTVVPAIVIAILVNIFVTQAMVVQGPSMQPNLHYDQRVMVEKVTYRFIHSPDRGDVVVIQVPGENEPLIKRVVALAGETVEVQVGQVLIDGELLDEPWAIQQGGPNYPPTLVSPLHVFVLGDNRPSSRDSRSFGPVSVEQLIGHAWLIYWPLDQIKLIEG